MFYSWNAIGLIVMWLSAMGLGEAQFVDEIVVNTKSDDHLTVFNPVRDPGEVIAEISNRSGFYDG